MEGQVIAVCTSKTKGVPKQAVGSAVLVENHGIDGDAHAGRWHRQVSLLAEESIAKMRAKGLDVGPARLPRTSPRAGSIFRASLLELAWESARRRCWR